MQSVRWVTFGISNALTRTVVHFFPCEGSVTAPYPSSCALRIFGQGLQEKKVTLEGARLSHPDGVRLEDAFSVLKSEQVGLFGLEVELTTTQPRVDITSSGCVVELASKGHSAKFWPKRLATLRELKLQAESPDVSAEVSHYAPLVRDCFAASSLVIVNGTAEQFSPALSAEGEQGDEVAFPVAPLLPLNCSEQMCDEASSGQFAPRECSWGLLRARVLALRGEHEERARGVFLLHRDTLTRRPVSVIAL